MKGPSPQSAGSTPRCTDRYWKRRSATSSVQPKRLLISRWRPFPQHNGYRPSGGLQRSISMRTRTGWTCSKDPCACPRLPKGKTSSCGYPKIEMSTSGALNKRTGFAVPAHCKPTLISCRAENADAKPPIICGGPHFHGPCNSSETSVGQRL